MAFLVLAIFVVVVSCLTVASLRTGASANGCCAPLDPSHDLRMRDALEETGTSS